MTQQRRDSHSTEFGIWLREQPEIDSQLGYVAINIDYVWRNYKTGEWMLIEEKRYNKEPKFYATQIFNILDHVARNDLKYRGFHIIIFENTSPDDGKTKIDGKEVTKEELIRFLQFKNVPA